MVQFPELSKEILRKGISVKSLTTFGVGAAVPILIEPRTLDEATHVFNLLKQEGINYKLIGNGSNLVLPDEALVDIALVRLMFKQHTPQLNYQGVSLALDDINIGEITKGEKVILEIPASFSMMGISRQTSALGLSGLEYSAGIPGTLGGAVRMNAGSHGSQLSDIILSVKVWDPKLQQIVELVNGGMLSFEYRHCSLDSDSIILSAQLDLVIRDAEDVKEKRASALKYRKETQPLSMPSAGSVFRNPTSDLSAAKILDDLGLKGYRVGGVMLSEMHSNWIVRVADQAKAMDVLRLVEDLKSVALKNTGIELREEIIFW